MAREVRRFLHWYIAERYNRSLHTEPEKAPCHSELSRGVEGRVPHPSRFLRRVGEDLLELTTAEQTISDHAHRIPPFLSKLENQEPASRERMGHPAKLWPR